MTHPDIEAMGEVLKTIARRYRVEGTTDDQFGGPPYRAPWYLIDTATAEPEVNWPGDLVAEYETRQSAHDHKAQLEAKAAWSLALDRLLDGVSPGSAVFYFLTMKRRALGIGEGK